ncbi:MAG TPA: type II secretion system protein GspJ [Desulfatiglandales bacterium]|nr:type II secretion system protein GspJ [Desulfatiglandales bacterium]
MSINSDVNLKNAKNGWGFTLIEILIALAIFSIIVSTIYTSYTGTFRILNETESQTEIHGIARIAMERMLEDLESVYIPKNIGDSQQEKNAVELFQFVGEDREIKGRNADILRFVSRAKVSLNGQEQDTGISEIVYYVKQNSQGEDLVLYRGDKPMFKKISELEEISDSLVLCENLMSINFTYYNEDNEALESWDSTSLDPKNKLPRMISIAMEFINASHPKRPIKFMTSLALPIEREYL